MRGKRNCVRVSTCPPKPLERCRTLFPEHEFSRLKQSSEFKIKGDLIPDAAAEEIIGELQAPGIPGGVEHSARVGEWLEEESVFHPVNAVAEQVKIAIRAVCKLSGLGSNRRCSVRSGIRGQGSRCPAQIHGAGRVGQECQSVGATAGTRLAFPGQPFAEAL